VHHPIAIGFENLVRDTRIKTFLPRIHRIKEVRGARAKSDVFSAVALFLSLSSSVYRWQPYYVNGDTFIKLSHCQICFKKNLNGQGNVFLFYELSRSNL
jgi:hypothetical protein